MSSTSFKSHFPQTENTRVQGKDLIYFDSAATTLKTESVIESTREHYSTSVANVHRGIHTLSEDGTQQYEKTRESVKNFINALSEKEIIFTKGTTESINIIASSYAGNFLEEGDEILISTMEHHSNIVPWQIIAEKKKLKIKEIPILDDGTIDLEKYKSLLSPKTKIVAVTHISNVLGTINPIKEMISDAHDAGSLFIVDGAQAVAHETVDVQDLDCDFYVFSAHKMFGPTGVGILYGKEILLEKMPPYQGGGAMIKEVSFNGTTFNDLPEKFEAGTPNIAGCIAFKEAIDFISNIGLSNIKNYEEELLQYATEKLKEIPNLKIIGEASSKASVISFVIEGVHHQDLGTLLDRQGIAIRTGHHCTQPLMKRFGITGTCRASFSIYNTKDEIDIFIESLKKSLEFL